MKTPEGAEVSILRVLLISSVKYWGGGELWMLSVARGLASRRHQVTLVCQPGSRLARRAVDSGITPVLVRLRGDFDPLVVARLYRLIRRRQIQLVCANMDKEVRLAGLAARLARIPLIRRRGSDMPFPNKLRFRLVDRYLVRLVIVNSRATKKTLLQGNPWLLSEKVRLIYNGVPPETGDVQGNREEVLREFGLEDVSPVLIIVGLLKERKGHEVLFRALPGVLKEFPHLVLFVVGEGELRGSLEELAGQLNIAQRVVFAGFRDDTPRLLNASDLLVLPSSNEGFGYVLAEAMSLCKPVVASRVSSIPEVVVDKETGLLVQPGDVRAMEKAILELMRHPQRAHRMGLAGRRRVREQFDLDRMLDQVEELFREVVAVDN